MISLKESRTVKVFRNASVGILSQVLSVIFSFVLRIVFALSLGKEYLGINGLFSNILMLLSFAELGLGNAIIFSMYKPLAEQNLKKVSSLLKFYKKAYAVIGVIFLLLGIILLPFIRKIIVDVPTVLENITYIYLLFLLNTVISYFFAHKKSLLIADQKNYVVTLFYQSFQIMQLILQTIVLLKFKNYYLFVIIMIIFTIMKNLAIEIYVNKKYAYIFDIKTNGLDKSEVKGLFSDVKALFLYKIGSLVFKNVDSIIISALLNVATYGVYSNYILLRNTLVSLAEQVMNAFTASFGNLNAGDDIDNKKNKFYDFLFISAWMYGLMFVGITALGNSFIRMIFGNDYVLPKTIPLLTAILFYQSGLALPSYIYRTTLGLFRKGKYTPLFAAFFNILLSLILGNLIGLSGILLASIISRGVTFDIVDPMLIHKFGFRSSAKPYIKKYISYVIFMIFSTTVILFFVYLVPLNGNGILKFIISLVLIILTYNILFFMVFKKTREYIDVMKKVNSLVLYYSEKLKNKFRRIQ